MTKKYHEDCTKCWICIKAYDKGEVKVKGHDHIIGKYWGYAHEESNVNLSLNKSSCFIIWKTMIYILSFKTLQNIIISMLCQKQ